MIEKAKQYIKKHDNITVVLIFLILFIGVGFNFNFTPVADETINFANIYKMYNGYVIYKDANVIITPLFFYIGLFLFKIFGANILIFRIYNIIIAICIQLILYNIFKVLKCKKINSLLYAFCIYFITKDTIIEGLANYNTLAIMIYLFAILVNIKYKPNYIINGILVFLIFMSKQNIGVYYIIGMLLNIMFIEKLSKKTIIEFIKTMSVFAFLFSAYCLYLYFNNNLYNFISYCFLGIKEFGSENFYASFYIMEVICYMIFIYTLKKFGKNKIVKNKFKLLNTLECYAIPMLLISFPIFNIYHINISVIGITIELLVLIDWLFLDELFGKYMYILNIIIIILFMIKGVSYSTQYIYCIKNNNLQGTFFGVALSNELENNIEKVKSYIKNNDKKTIVFGCKGLLYSMVLKTSNGAMDLPFMRKFWKRWRRRNVTANTRIKKHKYFN